MDCMWLPAWLRASSSERLPANKQTNKFLKNHNHPHQVGRKEWSCSCRVVSIASFLRLLPSLYWKMEIFRKPFFKNFGHFFKIFAFLSKLFIKLIFSCYNTIFKNCRLKTSAFVVRSKASYVCMRIEIRVGG